MSEYSPQATFSSLARVSPRGVVLDFCSTFGILSEVTSRKNLRSPFERKVAKRGVSPKANIFARGSRERAPIALLAKCEPLFAPKARGGSTRGSAKAKKPRRAFLFWWNGCRYERTPLLCSCFSFIFSLKSVLNIFEWDVVNT